MTEFELIEQIFLKLQVAQAVATGIEKGIGDDAAVTALPVGSRLVSCIDTLVQGRHFSADWAQVQQLAFAIGYKAVAVNVQTLRRWVQRRTVYCWHWRYRNALRTKNG